MKKKTKIYAGIGGGLTALMIMGMAASPSDTEDVTAADASAIIVDQAAPVEAVEVSEAAAEAPEPEAPALSLEQEQAILSAESYLDGFIQLGFSRDGLIDQLEFEGFSTEVATFAVDSLGVDWNAQAVISAENYMDMDLGYSRDGLIEQLEFEGFTPEQAAHAATAIGF